MKPGKYADLRVREARLKMSRSVSEAISRALSTFLLICILGIVLGLVAIVLLQWLNTVLGTPWGSLLVLGLFLVALVVLWLLRKRLFRGIFVGALAGDEKISSVEDLDREIERVDDKVKACHESTMGFVDGVREACGIAGTGIRVGGVLISFLKKFF